MTWMRQALYKLGWPVDSLTDGEIACEILRRWFSPDTKGEPLNRVVSLAAVQGIYAYLADTGNLDALCWSEDDDITGDDYLDDELALLHGDSGLDWNSDDITLEERRAAVRRPVREAIEFMVSGSPAVFGGWLIDASDSGIAFLVDTRNVPLVGKPITPTVFKRYGGTQELGFAVVVRSELITECLSLVCAQLEHSFDQIA